MDTYLTVLSVRFLIHISKLCNLLGARDQFFVNSWSLSVPVLSTVHYSLYTSWLSPHWLTQWYWPCLLLGWSKGSMMFAMGEK